MNIFKVGDICIGQHFFLNVEHNGMECTIIEGLEERYYVYDDGETGKSLSYMVEWEDGMIFQVDPHNIRLKKPPRETREIGDKNPSFDKLMKKLKKVELVNAD